MKQSLLPTFALALAAVAPHCASAQVKAVKPVPGYACMRLNITHEQAVDRTFSVPVYAAPSTEAEQVGTATIVPFVKEPFRPNQPFQEILTLGNKQAWIETRWLKPYATPDYPNAHCTPSVMSNGLLGIG